MTRTILIGLAVSLAARHAWAAPQDPPITAAAFGPDSQTIIVGSQAGIEVFQWPSLKSVRRLKTGLSQVHDLALSPDGRTLLAVGGDPGQRGGVELFAWPAEQPFARHALHEDSIFSAAWQPSGEQWATGSLDHTVWIRSRDGRPAIQFRGHSRSVLAVRFLPGGQRVVSAGRDSSLRLWEAAGGKLLRTLDNHRGDVRDLAVRPQTASELPMIASASADRTVRLWQPTIGRMVRFAKLSSPPLDIDWTPDGSTIVVSCADGHVRAINPDTVAVTLDEPAIDGWAYTIAARDRLVFVGGAGGQMQSVRLPPAAR